MEYAVVLLRGMNKSYLLLNLVIPRGLAAGLVIFE